MHCAPVSVLRKQHKGSLEILFAAQSRKTEFHNILALQRCWRLNSNYCPSRRGFKFIRPLNAFTIVRCTEQFVQCTEAVMKGLISLTYVKLTVLCLRYFNVLRVSTGYLPSVTHRQYGMRYCTKMSYHFTHNRRQEIKSKFTTSMHYFHSGITACDVYLSLCLKPATGRG
jgi:hypothetical protein